MLTHSTRDSLKPEQIARLLRGVIQAKNRAPAMRRLLAQRERMSYDDLATAVKKLADKNTSERIMLERCVRELVNAS